VVIGAELAHGKPHPLPYLEGLRLVGGRAEHAVAFEDSRAGMAAAKAAGIATVGIMTGLDEQQMEEAGVSLSVHDFADPRVLELLARTTLE
jgi:phosphoglycolate phosphatase